MLTKFKALSKIFFHEVYFKIVNLIDKILYSKTIFKSKDIKNNFTIYIKENFFFKSLYINDTKIIQSKLYKKDPSHLSLLTSQVLIIPTMLHSNPEDILIIGLGGGDLIRYYNKFLPNSNLTIIEKSNEIINIFIKHFSNDISFKNYDKTANNYFDSPCKQNKDQINIINDDIFSIIENSNNINFTKQLFDIIIFDGFIEIENFDLINKKSLNKIFNKLSENGILSFNFIFPNDQKFMKTLTIFQNYFKDNILIIYGNNINNIIMVACKNSSDSKYFKNLEGHNIIKNLHFKKEFGFIAEYC